MTSIRPAPSKLAAESRAGGRGFVFALWIGSELCVAILMTLVGPEGLAWSVGISALIAAVFAMAYGSVRVLRGHYL